MKTINIRNADRDDLENLLALNQSNLPHVGSISMPALEHLHSQAVYFPIAEFEQKTAGFLIAFEPEVDYASLNFLWFKKHYKTFIYIDRIVVAPEMRDVRALPSVCIRILNILPPTETSRSWHANITCDRKTKSPVNSTAGMVLRRSAPRKPKTAKRPSRFKSSMSVQRHAYQMIE